MPIEARGKKDPALAAAIKAGRLPTQTVAVDYVIGRKALRVGKELRQPGDPIPEAASWPRLESWLRSGAIEARPAGSVAQEPSNEPSEPVTVPAAPPAEPDEHLIGEREKPKSGLRPWKGSK